jgi:predicted phage-related endonuclease
MPLSDQQAAAREQAIGSSEVAALFNCHPHLSRFELWHRKAGNLPAPPSSRWATWGNVLEPAIAKAIAAEQGWEFRKVRRYIRHPRVRGMGCSLDYEVKATAREVAADAGEIGILEVKNVDRFIFNRWPDGAAPLHFELQLQHQLACAGRRNWAALGALVGGNSPLVLTYRRHAGAIVKIEREIAAFWQSIEARVEPQPDFERDYLTVAQLYGTAKEGSIRDFRGDQQLSALCAQYAEAQLSEKKTKTEKGAIKAQILEHIRDTETAITDGFKVCASEVPGGPVAASERKAYRSFRVLTLGGVEYGARDDATQNGS